MDRRKTNTSSRVAALIAAALGFSAYKASASAVDSEADRTDLASIDEIVEVRQLDDGSIELVLANGQTVRLDPDAITIKNGQILIPDAVADAIAEAALGQGNGGLILLGLALAGGIGAAVALGGGGEEEPAPSPPPPPPPPPPGPTSGNDTLDGTTGDDTIDGLAGNDTISGLGGNDTLIGSAGDDTLIGGAGDDTLDGGAGSDTLNGGSGDDRLIADGDDTVDGGDGFDTIDFSTISGPVDVNLSENTFDIIGDDGDVRQSVVNVENIIGSDGFDVLTGDDAANMISGGNGTDLLSGLGGDDTILGGDNNDLINGGAGVDMLFGGEDDDLFIVDSIDVGEVIDGGINNLPGIEEFLIFEVSVRGGDTVDFSNIAGGLVIDLDLAAPGSDPSQNGAVLDALDGNVLVSLVDIENINGSAGDDVIFGNSEINDLDGGAGNDMLHVVGGDNFIDGGEGIDTALFTEGAAIIVSLNDDGEAETSFGDQLFSIENLTGSASGGDTLSGNSAANLIRGLGGNDSLFGRGGNDTIEGGDGDDFIAGGGGTDTIDGGAGNDTNSFAGIGAGVTASIADGTASYGSVNETFTNIENLDGSDNDDVLTGDAGANILTGNGGDDVLSGGEGADTLTGGSGADTFILQSASSDDTITDFEDGVDVLDADALGDDFNAAAAIASAEQVGADTVITLSDSSTVTLENFDVGDLDITDFANLPFVEIMGTDADETLEGTDGDDDIDGGAGDDTLDGGAGNDRLDGGEGADTLLGGEGDDTLIADGEDTLDGGDDIDTADFSTQNAGGVVASLADETFSVGAGGTQSIINVENLIGSDEDDTLTGDAGDNTLTGGAGADILAGGAGIDTLRGGDGDDTFILTSIDEGEIIEGGDTDPLTSGAFAAANGTIAIGDTIDLSGVSTGVTVDLDLSGPDGPDSQAGGILDAPNGTVLVQLDDIENVIGTSGDDTLLGNNENNTLYGGDGDDFIAGGGGTDTLDGGAGNDTNSFQGIGAGVTASLTDGTASYGSVNEAFTNFENLDGSDNNDVLAGDAGDNVLTGNDGDDTLSGGAGNDTLTGGDGDDILAGGGGTDTIDGGAGNDTNSFAGIGAGVSATLNADGTGTASYGSVNETFTGIENLTGSDNDDTLIAVGAANNVISGGDGDDFIAGGGGTDTLDGGDGNDTNSFQGIGLGVTASLADGTASYGSVNETFTNFENLDGSDNDDVLTGDAGDNVLTGNDGDDILSGGAGNDTLTGGDGDDILAGGGGTDTIDGGAGNDTNSFAGIGAGVTASIADGTASYGSVNETFTNIENLDGSDNDDVLTGDAGDNVLTGNDGDDILSGGSGNDTLTGGDGDDILAGGGGTDTIDGGAGIDTNSFAGVGVGVEATLNADGTGTASYGSVNETFAGIENLTGSDNDDTLIAVGAADNVISGGAGDDFIAGGGGSDTLDGGEGTDTNSFQGLGVGVIASLANGTASYGSVNETFTNFENLDGSDNDDTLTGDAGANVLTGNQGDDILSGGAGDDTLTGGEGDDILAGGAGTDIIDGGAGIDTNSFAGIGVGVDATLNADGTGTASYGSVNETFTGIENLTGSDNDDTLIAVGAANNVISGGAGDDFIAGGGGTDTLDGGTGNDTNSFRGINMGVTANLEDGTASYGSISEAFINFENLDGSDHDDVLTGDNDANILTGNDGNDTLIGNRGNDILDGGAGNDTLSGGTGDDIYVAGPGHDIITAFRSGDTVDISAFGPDFDSFDAIAAARQVDRDVVLEFPTGDTLTFVSTQLSFLQRFSFISEFHEVIRWDGRTDVVADNLGNDTIFTEFSGASSDNRVIIDLDIENDDATGLSQNGAIFDGNGNVLVTVTDIENIDGTRFNDTIIGNSESNRINGFNSSDFISGNGGIDVLDGGGGFNDVVTFEWSDQGVIADLVSETSTFGAIIDFESIIGTNFDDVLTLREVDGGTLEGLDGDDILNGNFRDDILLGGDGNDVLDGGRNGRDILDGGAGDDILTGGSGTSSVDTFVFAPDSGNDIVTDFIVDRSMIDVTSFGNVFDVEEVIRNAQQIDNDVLLTFGPNSTVLLQNIEQSDLLLTDFLAASNETILWDGFSDVVADDIGIDTIDLSGVSTGVVIDLDIGNDSEIGLGQTGAILDIPNGVTIATVFDIESVIGSAGDDIIFGNNENNQIFAGDGDDLVQTYAGTNFIDGGSGIDTISFAGLSTGIDLSLSIFDRDFDPNIRNFERIIGTDVDDVISGINAPDGFIDGGAGNDIISGMNFDDVLVGGAGADIIDGGERGSDTLEGGLGDDILTGDDSTFIRNADVFVFDENSDNDTITDFGFGDDVLDVTAFGAGFNVDAVIAGAQQVGNDVMITLGTNSTVLLQNFDLANLDASDFIVETDPSAALPDLSGLTITLPDHQVGTILEDIPDLIGPDPITDAPSGSSVFTDLSIDVVETDGSTFISLAVDLPVAPIDGFESPLDGKAPSETPSEDVFDPGILGIEDALALL